MHGTCLMGDDRGLAVEEYYSVDLSLGRALVGWITRTADELRARVA